MKPLIAIMGPTATGKSDLGVELAKALGGEVINADALQVYRRLDIGTAKPPPAMRRAVPHHLIDILEPSEVFSVGEFVRRARRAIEEIRSRGRRPILVGGSGLYLRSLIDGISPMPVIDPEVRARVRERCDAEGPMPLLEELRGLDPKTAARLEPGDRQRISRALEVVLSSGRPLSEWIASRPSGSAQIPAVRIGLTVERGILYDRISSRIQQMVERGWVAEVDELLNLGVEPEAPGFQAIGYRQIVRHVVGEWSLEEAMEDTARATRRYAKRQLTWFRRERDIRWLPALEVEQFVPALIREFSDS